MGLLAAAAATQVAGGFSAVLCTATELCGGVLFKEDAADANVKTSSGRLHEAPLTPTRHGAPCELQAIRGLGRAHTCRVGVKQPGIGESASPMLVADEGVCTTGLFTTATGDIEQGHGKFLGGVKVKRDAGHAPTPGPPSRLSITGECDAFNA
eukprot:CAMPEP_0181507610 /NCGR_PEP_ID=MMETSP1110-20121109/59247_1 /TAXON_ID=174948 /ORGANISM="Symbiodinium sp., Strain CCMP421" /LENGTH=152 /DNA_ID=CAMNT_0023636801 /DNA_START=226 /DNA_END=685 /DNA_ORIENTATION=+